MIDFGTDAHSSRAWYDDQKLITQQWVMLPYLLQSNVQVSTLLCHERHHATHGEGVHRLSIGIIHIISRTGPAINDTGHYS